MQPIDTKIARLNKRYKGISNVLSAIDNLYIFGVYPQNFPNLSVVLDEAKDHLKIIAKDTKREIAELEEPNSKYDLTDNDTLEVIDDNNE